MCEEHEAGEGEEKEAVRSGGTALWSDPGVVRMEIRPDRFKAVAAKTLGKIYGYVRSLRQLHNKSLPEIIMLKMNSKPFMSKRVILCFLKDGVKSSFAKTGFTSFISEGLDYCSLLTLL